MKRPLAILAGVGLLAAAYAVAATTPASEFVEAPFGSRGSIGEQISSSNVIVTVHTVSLAHEVELEQWRGTTSGIWLVGEATVEATIARTSSDVDLFIDGVQYPSTSRADNDTVDGSVVDVRFPVTGPFLIELPADVLDRPGAHSAVLRFSPGFDPRLDGVVELVIDLTTLDVDDRVEFESTRDGIR